MQWPRRYIILSLFIIPFSKRLQFNSLFGRAEESRGVSRNPENQARKLQPESQAAASCNNFFFLQLYRHLRPQYSLSLGLKPELCLHAISMYNIIVLCDWLFSLSLASLTSRFTTTRCAPHTIMNLKREQQWIWEPRRAWSLSLSLSLSVGSGRIFCGQRERKSSQRARREREALVEWSEIRFQFSLTVNRDTDELGRRNVAR